MLFNQGCTGKGVAKGCSVFCHNFDSGFESGGMIGVLWNS